MPQAFAAEPGLQFGPPEPFSYEGLIERARQLAARPYVPPPTPAPEVVQQIDYDAHHKLAFKPDLALFGNGPGTHPVIFQFLGKFFTKSVQMHVLEAGSAREILYSPDYFTIDEDSPARQLPPDTNGFAGFWVRESRFSDDRRKREVWFSFLGAAYFRAVSGVGQWGMSARGVAIDVAGPHPEEFPDFVAHWITSAATENDPVVIHSLLDGPSITGAFRFSISRTVGTVMEIESHLFARQDIERLGIAPLTSMFWFSEYGRERLADGRPEVHDADGLVIWNGAGERIFRPLNNPTRIFHTSYLDNNPKGFGLTQRDRNFDHYLDGVGYEKRPNVWVEPLGDWGKGVVQLVEIPTDDEIHDNIVAYWLPERPTHAGDALSFHYRLYWLDTEYGFPTDALAKVVATRMGRGGPRPIPGKPFNPHPKGLTKFVIDFQGEPLMRLRAGAQPEPMIWTSRGSISLVQVGKAPNQAKDYWRLFFDLEFNGNDPVEMRVFLHDGTQILTETWLYLFEPPPIA
jgi:glucans biosynthesis protein